MKVSNLQIKVRQVSGYLSDGEITEHSGYVCLDSMNSTFMWVNDVELKPVDTEYGEAVLIPILKKGDRVFLTTRSSSWEGVVDHASRDEAILTIEGEGVFASIVNGLSGLISWEVFNSKYAIIETSLCKAPVSFDKYVGARHFADTFSVYLSERNAIITKLLEIASQYPLPTPPKPEGDVEFFFISGEDEFLTDEELLGAATLAKIRSGKPVFSDDDDDDDF